eukprot:4161086-Amphidinium_carterae.1
MQDLQSAAWHTQNVQASRASRWAPPAWLGMLEEQIPNFSAGRPKADSRVAEVVPPHPGRDQDFGPPDGP